MAEPRRPALDVGAERRRAGGRASLPAERDAHAAAGGERRVPAAGRTLLRPGRALRARAAAPRPQVRAALVAGLGAGADGRRAPAGRRGVPAPAVRRGGAVAARGSVRVRAGRHALRRPGSAQYAAHGAGRLRAGGRALSRVVGPAASRHEHRGTPGARAPGPGRRPRQGAARVRSPGSAVGEEMRGQPPGRAASAGKRRRGGRGASAGLARFPDHHTDCLPCAMESVNLERLLQN